LLKIHPGFTKNFYEDLRERNCGSKKFSMEFDNQNDDNNFI